MQNGGPPIERTVVSIPAGEVVLPGDLSIPTAAHGIVLFAHGSGSSRHSPRNQYVAKVLNRNTLATLLVDLLTPPEERQDEVTAELRFDIPFLTRRLGAVADQVSGLPRLRGLGLGLFGASTGAAAALLTAAERPDLVKAVVSRGGRPDLAGPAIALVRAPTLLIVGGADRAVLKMNREAMPSMRCEIQLSVIPDSTHLLEEPGALEKAAKLAAGWFTTHLAA